MIGKRYIVTIVLAASPSNKKPAISGGFSCFSSAVNLAAVIHIKFHRMRCHAVAVLFFLFQIEIALDLILGEHAAFEQEFMIGFEGVDCFLQAAAHGWNFGQFCGWQIIQVLDRKSVV